MRVIGTAGHVDHGKSTLVLALTGINPDRLQEEQDRQMTIDLGFAWFSLEDGNEVGIVDVPGHRDFIENMLAGIGPIDAVLFVIAADEGIMPQTREHLAIIDLLAVPTGLIALTKIDLAESEWVDLVIEEVSDLLAGTVLQDAPILPVSSVTGAGMDELTETLARLLSTTPAQSNLGRPRLPVDRVFTLTGFGTVVTGTLIGGKLAEGQEVTVHPRARKARIRSLQSHKSKRASVEPGGRVAINLSGIDKSDIVRGDVVTLPEQWKQTRILDGNFRMLADLGQPLKHHQEVKFFHGSAQRMARVRLIGQAQIDPGQQGWIQLILNEPIVADRGDRFILRRPSPGTTLGGGQIVDPHPQARYRLKDTAPVQRLEALHGGDERDLVIEFLRRNGPSSFLQLNDLPMLDGGQAESILPVLVRDGAIVILGAVETLEQAFFVTQEDWQKARDQAVVALSTYHKRNHLRPGMPIEEFRKRMKMDPKWASRFMEAAALDGWVKNVGNFVGLPEYQPELSDPEKTAAEKLMNMFAEQPYNTPSRREIIEEVGDEVLQFLTSNESLVALSDDVFLTRQTYDQAVVRVRDQIVGQGTITIAEVRDLFETSRKYALALMEHLDAIGITRRDGDVRRLAG